MATRSTAGRLEALITDVQSLEELACRVQGDDDQDGLTAATELEQQYEAWYLAALAVLPDDLREAFRFEYEGKLSLTELKYRIKHFLQDPRGKSAVYREDMNEASKRVFSPWQHPVKDRFLGPIRQQRQLLGEALARHGVSSTTADALELLEQIARRLPVSLSILQSEHRGKSGLTISEEVDLQHILHAIAVLHFEEVEPEEPTPKIAGGSSRLDFLLKQERVAIETKMMRPSLSKEKVRKELAADIVYFRAHPNVDALFVLIYDPTRKITNAAGFERDLYSDSEDLTVRVVIAS